MTDNTDKLTKLTRDVMTAFTERYTEAPEAFLGSRLPITLCWVKMGIALGLHEERPDDSTQH